MAVVVSCVVTLPSFVRDDYYRFGTGLTGEESRMVFFGWLLANEK